MDNVATPEAFKLADPITVDPFRKLTVPEVGLAPPVLNVATRLSAWPAVTGFGVAVKFTFVEESTCSDATADLPDP